MTLRQIRNYIIIFAVVVLGLVGLNYFTNTTLNDTMELTIDLTTLQEVVQSIETIRDALEEERIAIGQYPLSGNAALLDRIDAAQQEYDQAWARVVANRGESMAVQIEEIETARATYIDLLEEVKTEYQSNPSDNRASQKLSTAINYYLQNLDPKISNLADPEIALLNEKVAIQSTRSLDLLRATQGATLLGIIISGVALVMTILTVFAMGRMVRAIDTIVSAANAISRGDLDIPIDVEQRGEIGDMAQAIERMRTSLKAAIERLRR
jgi:HAMP domain-containing protein